MNSNLSVYRSLKHAIRSQYTKINGNKYWEALFLSTCRKNQSHISSSSELQKNQLAASNLLFFMQNKEKYESLVTKFSHKLTQQEQISRTANLVGLQLPKQQ